MKRKLQLALLGAFLGALSLVSAASADEPVNIWPDSIPGLVAYEDQEIIYNTGWIATTPGLVNMYLNATEGVLSVTGPGYSLTVPDDQFESYWGPLVSAPSSLLGLDCPSGALYGAFWSYSLGTLAPGDYTFTLTETLVHPVNDGYHTCTEIATGLPASPTPSIYEGTEAWTYTLTVLSGP